MASLRRDPARRNARDARAWLRLACRGEFARAWRVSDRIRRRTVVFGDPSVPRHMQQVWDGRSLDGRHVLVHCYHGLGDTIQWARYLSRLRSHARSVTVWAQARLIPILRTIDAEVTYLPLHAGTPELRAEVDIEIMELAYAFRTTLGTIPATVPYLHAAALPVVDDRCPKVGLVWRAGEWDRRRSIPFHQLVPLLERDTTAWYALQLDQREQEHHPMLKRLDCSTILATAGYLKSMDLVLTIDSMAAHLAGALGVPTWTLLRRHADWRWMQHRQDCPWYPTMRLFRQPVEGDWSTVIAAVGRALDCARRRRWRTS